MILYGPGSERWRNGLAPDGGVWDGVPGVAEVIVVDRLGQLLRQGWAGGRQSLVIPLKNRALQRFPRLYWNLAPSRFALETCADKIRFARFMVRAGFADLIPQSWGRSAKPRFPCVVKRNNKDGGAGVKVVRSAEDLAATMAVRPFNRWRPVIFQELIDGLVDCATHCVVVDGRIVWHVSYAYDIDPVTRVQTIDVHAARRRIELPAAALVRFEQVLAALRYSGPASFDWRPRGDSVVLFEINPRFGGSLMLDINRDDLRAALTALVQHARPPEWLPG